MMTTISIEANGLQLVKILVTWCHTVVARRLETIKISAKQQNVSELF